MGDAESLLVQELRLLAGGAAEDRFELRHESVVVRVRYSGGSSSSLEMRATYDSVARVGGRGGDAYRGSPLAAIRPMAISLRPERDVERKAKAAGMDVEVQTNDPAFDQAVYVDTQTPGAVVVQVLGPEVRQAVLDLFALEFTTITIDDKHGDVVAEIVTFASLEAASSPGARAVDAFARLARALPRVTTLPGEHQPHPLKRASFMTSMLAMLTTAIGGSLYFWRNPYCDESTSGEAACFGPLGLGAAVGVAAAGIVGLFASSYARRHRGRSDSSAHASLFTGAAAIAAFWILTIVTAFVIAFVR